MQGLWPHKTVTMSEITHVGENVYSIAGTKVPAGNVFTGDDDLSIWISDDDNRKEISVTTLDNLEFINKYQDIMTIAPYIDGMYYINSEKKELQEIYVKKYPNDVVKSTKAKVITLSKIVKDLTSDQYNLIAMYANDTIKDKSDEISFVIPETHCPKCGAKIEEQTFSASQLLFLRHRLAALANS